MKEIVFASCNPKKAAEIQRMAPEGIKVICLKDIPEAANVPQADETGKTFVENAEIKAKYWAEKLGKTVLAEDSGIEIEALNGAPGVYTKRCIEKFRPGVDVNVDNPDELYPMLLELMKESGNVSTSARWVSAMVLVEPKEDSQKVFYAEECLQGNMCSRAGKRVFGFDQYFKPVGFEQTLSELAPEKKDELGPRKKAFSSILNQL